MTNNAGVPVDGRLLKAARFRKRLTQAEVAEQVGCSASAVRHLEKGRQNMSLPLLRRYEAFFGEEFYGRSWP
jgi:transcriptional regulator with XRE-family HTH domain